MNKIIRIIISIYLICVPFALVMFQSSNVKAQAVTNGVCVFYYGAWNGTVKARFIAAPPEFLVLNTPGGSYKAVITEPIPADIADLQAAGIKVLSYVSTGGLVGFIYAADSPPNNRTFVRGCIDTVSAEGCDGIFFDEGGVGTVKSPPDGTYTPCHADKDLAAPAIDCNGNANSWSGFTIQDYLDYAQTKGLIRVLGTDYREAAYLDQDVFTITDYIMTDEGYPLADGRVDGAPQWQEIGYEDQCWVISGSVADATTGAAYTQAALDNGFDAAYHCVNYGTLAVWYETYLSLLVPPTPPPPLPPSAHDLVSIAISPTSISTKNPGDTQQFAAVGTYDDSTTQIITGSVTWYSSRSNVSVNAAGLANCLVIGYSDVYAAYDGILSNVVRITITMPAPAPPAPPPTSPGTPVDILLLLKIVEPLAGIFAIIKVGFSHKDMKTSMAAMTGIGVGTTIVWVVMVYVMEALGF